MGWGMTSAARLHELKDLALASTLGGDVVVGGQGAGSSGQPHAAAHGLHPWLVAYRRAARKRGGHTYVAAASAQVEKRVLLFPELNVRFSRFQSTSFWVG
jgi:hypothetical protein